MKKYLDAINKWLVTTPRGRMVRTFILTAVGLALADWIQSGQISLDHWTTWVIVPAAPLLGVLYDYLSKNFPLFGVVAASVESAPNVDPTVKQIITEAHDNANS